MKKKPIEKELKNVSNALKKAKSVSVFPHISADGDAIGGAFGIAFVLKDMKKRVKVFLNEAPGKKLEFLLGNGIDYEICGEEGSADREKYDVALVTDCSDRKRVGTRFEKARESKTLIKFDHHIPVDNFGDINAVEEHWAATCEGLYLLAKKLGYSFGKNENGKNAAVSFYTGLLTDSGQFGYSNTTENTLKTASELMHFTGDMSDVVRMEFSIKPVSEIRIKGIALANAEFLQEGMIAFTHVTKEDIDLTGATPEDTNGISSELCAVYGVEVSAFVRPDKFGKEGLKVSLRSYNKCNVAEIAAKFGGGGHERAAGFEYQGSIEELKKIIVEEVEKNIEQGCNSER